jgi:hypothetical protein
MTERTEGPGELDARLAEFDRRLREIQAELLADEAPPVRAHEDAPAAPEPPLGPDPGIAPSPSVAPPPGVVPSAGVAPSPEPDRSPPQPRRAVTQGRAGPLAELLAQLRTAPDGYRSDLGDLRELVTSVRALLGGIEAALVRIEAGDHPGADTDEATIAAGPFTTIEAVRAFEREVAALPGVRDAAVRGYEGAARAIIDVRLGTDEGSLGADL